MFFEIRQFAFIIGVCISCFEFTNSEVIFSPSDLRWKLRNGNKSISVEAKVPGGVYGSLMDGGFLHEGDFYYRYNDIKYRYVSYDNWTYSTKFSVPENILNEEKIVIEFDGLDTISSVSFNNKIIGHSNNMFSKYTFDISDKILHGSKQFLTIVFESPVTWSKLAYDKQSDNYPVPPKCVDPAFKGECHANHIRKMQASFAWDWGPAFPNLGIWKPWRLIGWSSIKIDNIIVKTTPIGTFGKISGEIKEPKAWRINLKIQCYAAMLNKEFEGMIKICLNKICYVQKRKNLISTSDKIVITESFVVTKVRMWWPNGYGEQNLYNLSVVWSRKNSTESSSNTVKIGFRTIELDQNYVSTDKPELGRHFRFIVNNVTMFMKGSNWIPSHILPEKMDLVQIRELLSDAARTYQNCIRVWGGGIYESDEFYEITDELGILVWQDFMFACSMYPATSEFLKSVQEEVTNQVHRLQHHPSIVIWAANNENEAALRGNWYGTKRNFKIYQRDYVKLYVDTVRSTTLALDDTRPFLVSSPTNGIKSEEEGYVARNPYDNKYGDVHFYNYVLNGWNWTIYPKTRFASEYGFQSWPSFRTLSDVTAPEDRRIDSKMMNHRQHHPFGSTEFRIQLDTHFNTKCIFGKDNLQSYKNYLYLTQVNQAMAIKTETEFYRRSQSELDDNGEGLTSGALYWQLNDIWQGASWSSIEYGGKWKILHYYAMKFFRPILLSPWIEKNKVKISLVNDMLQDFYDLTVTVQVQSYENFFPLIELTSTNITTVSQSSSLVVEYDLESDLKLTSLCNGTIEQAKNHCFLVFRLNSERENSRDLADHDTFLLLGEPKDAPLRNPRLQVTDVTLINSTRIKVSLKATSVALFVWLDTEVKGVFSDNGFLMFEPTKQIIFEAREETSKEEFLSSLEVVSLADTLQGSCDKMKNNQNWFYKIVSYIFGL